MFLFLPIFLSHVTPGLPLLLSPVHRTSLRRGDGSSACTRQGALRGNRTELDSKACVGVGVTVYRWTPLQIGFFFSWICGWPSGEPGIFLASFCTKGKRQHPASLVSTLQKQIVLFSFAGGAL